MNTILIIVLAIIITILITIASTAKFKGWIAERRVNNILLKINKKNNNEFCVAWDVMLKWDDKTTQIDNILITKRAIYVIEVKNIAGRLYGDEEGKNWTNTRRYVNTRTGRNGKTYTNVKYVKNSIYSPFQQNKTHCRKLIDILHIPNWVPVFNVVAFGRRSNISNVNSDNVIKIGKVKRYIKHKEASLNVVYTQGQIDNLKKKINEKNVTCKKARKQHVDYIRRSYK